MMVAKTLAFLVLAVAVTCEAKSVIVGDMFGNNGANRLIFQKTVEADGYPFIRREQEVYFEYPNPGLQIKGIAIRDLNNSEAEASISRGGIGFGFVNIKLKSERGSGLRYSVEVYA